MIERYKNTAIATIWANQAKLLRWDDVELAVLEAGVSLGDIEPPIFTAIDSILKDFPPDEVWWKDQDEKVGHDLQAYVDERRRHMPVELQFYFHRHMTSFDTEEAAFARALIESTMLVLDATDKLLVVLKGLAKKYRYALKLARTHGQWAKLKTFGAEILGWVAEVAEVREQVAEALQRCRRSKLSGAVGNYGGGLSPELEKKALEILGFEPFYGATQIIPRVLYTPLAQCLCNLGMTIGGIALDFRLGARSGMPFWHEPFGRNQKGSSAMPHKKNTILTEQMEGMDRMSLGFMIMLMQNLKTWEARAIEQSCVERVAWPDLFHILMRVLGVMTRVLRDAPIYPDHMLEEIKQSRGTYASDEAKNYLGEVFAKRGLSAEVAYRMVQLASFNVFEPSALARDLRQNLPQSPEEADEALERVLTTDPPPVLNIQDLIMIGALSVSPDLDVSHETVAEWNEVLKDLFADEAVMKGWLRLFEPSFLLRGEKYLYEQIL